MECKISTQDNSTRRFLWSNFVVPFELHKWVVMVRLDLVLNVAVLVKQGTHRRIATVTATRFHNADSSQTKFFEPTSKRLQRAISCRFSG